MKYITLTKNQKSAVDDGDFEFLSKFKWHAYFNKSTDSFYAARSVYCKGKKLTLRMHRAILGLIPGDGIEADHINHDTLDNRRENLRAVSRKENAQNRKNPEEHGSWGKYAHGCRCDLCRIAGAAYTKEYRMRNPIDRVRTHGAGGYTSGCRCVLCREGRKLYQRKRRAMVALSR